MYLSKIEVIGFKSFAQRVNVNFDSGVTAIVGPNGCGKTNIVDAIRWALGEQKYSTLRSDKMEDVIFNGTKNRKPLGLAEVSLSIENSKGILPTEYSEVTITRRVFRSGESEYLLNKVPCRLKDILDLFMDTGMGSDAYSVIELKMIETILSDKTDERRKLFEEAAGVTKYKHRRKAAMRKLESVQLDLTRVNDIVKEVGKTVNSLERQAKKAEQYNEVSTRLKSLEIDLQEREYAYLHNKLKPLEAKLGLAQSDRAGIDEALCRQEAQIDSLHGGMQEIERQLGEAQRLVSAQFESIHRVEEKMLVSNERMSALSSNIERYEAEKTDLRGQSELLAVEKTTYEGRKLTLATEVVEVETAYARSKVEADSAIRVLDSKKLEVQALQDAILQLAHDLIQKRGEHERIKARIDNLKGRIDRATEDSLLYETDIARNEEQIGTMTTKDRDLRRQFVEGEMLLIEREKAKKNLMTGVEALQQELLELRNEVDRRESKVDFIKRMIENNEGQSDGARYLLGADPWKEKQLTTVADVVHADEKYRRTIEAALGDAANFLVVENVEDGYAAVEELQRENKGRANFICLQWIPKIVRRGDKKQFPCTSAADVVECDERYRSLIQFLLEDVVIVDSIREAKEVFANRTGIRCITSEGQIIGSTGLMRGGGRRLDEGGLIGKKEQITELEAEAATYRCRLDEVITQRHARSKEVEAFDLKTPAEAVKSVEREMTSIEMRIAQLEFEKKRANDGLDRNRTEIESLRHEVTDLEVLYVKAGEELSILELRKGEQERVAGGTAHELELCEADWESKSRAVNELEIRLITAQGDARNVDRDIERTEARLNDIQVTLLRRDAEIAHAQEEIGRLTLEAGTYSGELADLRTAYNILEQRRREISQTHQVKRSELHDLELRVKDERRLHDDAVSATHDLEMKIAEIISNIDHLRQRAKEEFELELHVKEYPADEFVDFAHLREEVKNLKDRIRILGAINFAAFDEFTTESERLTFLTQQRDDLLEAEKTLLATIDEINRTAQMKFSETFAKIRENFITIFKELFHEGDECDLKIEEEVDPLEAKIEIIAKPRGKRPTSIDLLSGGEKTLTAIALLFAIYLVKPSPFCILDEVDAPLDDSNIDRYTRILKKFSGNTQFIVVTHNKRTMESAHALYGVTMEEEGVSKVVTVRFNEEARVRSATVTN